MSKNLTGFYKAFGISAPDTSDIFAEEKEVSEVDSVSSTKSTITSTTYSMKYFYIDGVDYFHCNDALDLACSYLEGCYDDYVFFQDTVSSANSDYVLLVGDLDYQNGSLSLNSCTGYLFRYQNSYSTYFSNRIGSVYFPSLTLVDGSGSSVASPNHKENISLPTLNYISDTTTFQLYTMSFEDESYTLGQDDFIYSSFEGTPHLIEGVQNYAFAAFLLAAAVITFNLIDRVFRRVY